MVVRQKRLRFLSLTGMDKLYARALYEVSTGKSTHELSKIAANFFALLKQKGHRRLLSKILRRYEEMLRATEAKNTVTIRLGHQSALAGIQRELTSEIKKVFGEGSKIETRVDEKLIGGYLVEGNALVIDRSHKNALLTLFTTMIS